jgi:hypothetical protein
MEDTESIEERMATGLSPQRGHIIFPSFFSSALCVDSMAPPSR